MSKSQKLISVTKVVKCGKYFEVEKFWKVLKKLKSVTKLKQDEESEKWCKRRKTIIYRKL